MTTHWDEEADFEADLCVTATVRCKGYNDPGRCSGPPEDCYPPEGDNEGTVLHVLVGDVEFTPDMTAEAAKAAVDKLLAAVEKDIDSAVCEWEPA
jgi:hypothetical protein